ncbi:MAG: Beta-glucanase/Beta-glucan synthetase [Nitrospira sp.]|jgi:beta-glucanase (GH16 family)|nr:Beta-glucanase/Beta-glucan synthetase [Nitrospira sp.]
MQALIRQSSLIFLVLYLSFAGCGFFYIPSSSPDLTRAVLTFGDEFDGRNVDSSKWNVISRNIFYPGVLSSHNPNMVSVENGYLKIDLRPTPYLSMKHSGGEIDTRDIFHQQYGYFEARIKMPAGRGVHPAWWLWPQSDEWPPEIDIAEIKGSEPTNVYMTVHWSEDGIVREHPEQVDFSGDHFAEVAYEGSDFTEDFHVYGLAWAPDTLVWYIDGVERHRTTEHVPSEPFMLVLDLALDGYGGPPDASTFLPASMLVDYVRVYRWGDVPLESSHSSRR